MLSLAQLEDKRRPTDILPMRQSTIPMIVRAFATSLSLLAICFYGAPHAATVFRRATNFRKSKPPIDGNSAKPFVTQIAGKDGF